MRNCVLAVMLLIFLIATPIFANGSKESAQSETKVEKTMTHDELV